MAAGDAEEEYSTEDHQGSTDHRVPAGAAKVILDLAHMGDL
jgi:hypothetical protein